MWCVIDVETTGIYDYSKPAEADGQPRLASAAMIFADEDFAEQRIYHALVKPDGWIMPAAASAINGLTTEQLERDGVPIAEVLSTFADAVDEERAFCGHNIRFDLKAFRAEFRRAKLDDRFERTRNLCTMRAMTPIIKEAPTNAMMAAGRKAFKPPKLAEAYHFVTKKPIEGAHTALGDARACLEIARYLKRIGKLPPPEVHFAKEGTKAGEALRARREAESTEETMPSTHLSGE